MLKRKQYWSYYTNKIFKFDKNSQNYLKKIKIFLVKKNNLKLNLHNPKLKLGVNKDAYVKVEKEITSRINNNVDFFFKSRFSLKDNLKLSHNNYFLIKNKKQISISALFFLLRKNKILFGFGRKKQFLFNLLEIVFCLREDFWGLAAREFFNNYFSVLDVQKELSFFLSFKNFLNWNLFNNVLKSNNSYSKFFILAHDLCFINFFYSTVYFNAGVNLKNVLNFDINLFLSSFKENSLGKYINKLNISNFYSVRSTYNKLLGQYLYLSFFKGRNNNIQLKNNNHFLNYIKQNFIAPKLNFSRYVWKKSLMFGKKVYSKKRNFGWWGIHNSYNRELPRSIFFLLSRLQEKQKLINANRISIDSTQLEPQFSKLNEILNYLLKNKIKREKTKNLVLSKLPFLKKLNRRKWSSVFLKNILSKLQNLNVNILTQISSIKNKLNKKNYSHSRVKSKFLKVRNLRKKALWKEKKLVQKNDEIISPQFKQINKFFSFIFKTNTTIYFINALSLTKFSFVFPDKKKSVQKFLNQIEREMIERYKYVAVYIQDLVRVSFLSLFLKKPTFLASFIGFQMAKLPRNRKETKLTRFIIKVVKIFSSQRKEMIGMKIEFKGRVNRWRRTKIIRGISGVLPLYSYNTRIEFGSSKAITRKGALGIRLWLCYRPSFEEILRVALFNYLQYSQYLRARSIKHFLTKFNHKL